MPSYFTKYGFGYDHSSDTYKVVAVSWYESLINGNRAMKTQVNVHTMGTIIFEGFKPISLIVFLIPEQEIC